MTKEEVLQTIKAVAKEMLDETPSHFDAEVDGEVYSDIGRVSVILKMNKKLCAVVESLPDVPDTNDGDMISRKAAIEALKEAFNPSITNFVKAKIAIDKLPSAQQEQRWIPCSERTPEEYGNYLVTKITRKVELENGYKPHIRLCVESYTQKSHWGKSTCGVVAWMPLPDPYGGEA